MRGFTLVEVIVAVGVLALTVTAGLATLAALAREAEEQLARVQARRLGDAIAIELAAQRSGDTAPEVDGLDALAATVPPAGSALSLNLVVSRDGLQVRREGASDFPPAEQFYLVELRQLGGPLDYAANPGALSVAAVVRWPFHVPTGAGALDWVPGTLTPDSSVTLCLAIGR